VPSSSDPPSSASSGFTSPSIKLQLRKHLHREGLEGALVVEREREAGQIGALLDPVAHQSQAGRGGGGRLLAGQRLAHHQRQRGRQRHLFARAGAGDRIGAQPHVERMAQIVGDARIAAAAQRLDARTLDRVEHRARHCLGGGVAQVHRAIVMLQPQREPVGEATRLRHLLRRQRARRHRNLDMFARL
jgi:hypothetical protein